MTGQDLRNSILQLAIQGKLVEQREEEGTARELIEEIKAEKERLVKEKKIRKEKPLPEISEDEIPFDIPESWEWVRLGELIHVISGVSYKKHDIRSEGIRILRGGNIQDMNICIESDDVFLPASYLKNDKLIRVGDIIIVASTGSLRVIGKPGYVDNQIKNTMIGAFLRICRPFVLGLSKYTKLIFESEFYRSHIRRLVEGTNIKNIREAYITEFIVPLPPLKEQERIVEKIEELMPYVDKYGETHIKLEELNNNFPTDMQKSILQYAIQGKLVEQRKEEGAAEELYKEIQKEKEKLIEEGKIRRTKALAEISEDEIPFDIPESWKWVRLGNLISITSGKGLTKANMRVGNIPVYGGNGITGFHNKPLLREKTVVIGRVGFYCGSVHVTEKLSWVTDNAFITSYPQKYIDRQYLVYTLTQMNLGRDNKATAQPVVSGKKIYPLLFPLPPLEEQKRIVSEIERLLKLCNLLRR